MLRYVYRLVFTGWTSGDVTHRKILQQCSIVTSFQKRTNTSVGLEHAPLQKLPWRTVAEYSDQQSSTSNEGLDTSEGLGLVNKEKIQNMARTWRPFHVLEQAILIAKHLRSILHHLRCICGQIAHFAKW